MFPYQLVGFLDREPAVGESAYNSDKGWYVQLALKRRFTVRDMSEEALMQTVANFCSQRTPLRIKVGGRIKPEHMPVHVLEVEPSDDVLQFHADFIKAFGDHLVSRYPERDGEHYYPHITAEYDGKDVIDAEQYANRDYVLNKVWLLKDVLGSEDSQAYASFYMSE